MGMGHRRGWSPDRGFLVPDEQLFEYYNEGDDSFEGIDIPTTWFAQSFTPQIAHTITKVKIKCFRTGTPGTITVSLRATDGNGHPVGGDLTSGSFDGDTITTEESGEWTTVGLSSYNLSASVKYAIVLRASETVWPNEFDWRIDSSSPTYTNGEALISLDSGETWEGSEMDLMFEEWGR